MSQLEVTILGQSYVLACPDGGERDLLEAVATVDREMSGIRDAGKVKARERIAVLAALNLAYQLAAAAQRPTTVPGAATAAPVPPACALPTAMPPGADGLDVDALMQRVDAALGDDGQLL